MSILDKLQVFHGTMDNGTIDRGLFLRSIGEFLIPDFQRELVWTREQKILLVESVMLNLPIGFYIMCPEPEGFYLLDGQQRWNAIFEFVDGEFPVFGYSWGSLSKSDQQVFRQRVFPYFTVASAGKDWQKEIYTRLAYGGTPHEPISSSTK